MFFSLYFKGVSRLIVELIHMINTAVKLPVTIEELTQLCLLQQQQIAELTTRIALLEQQ